VGNLTLGVRLAADADRVLAADVVRGQLGVEPVLSRESGQLNVALEAADRVADVLIALRRAGIHVTSVSVDKPTLDEVFLALTGRQDAGASEQPAASQSQAPTPQEVAS
jgi:ABC-2 type transport system ATP-binding protein